MKGRLWVPPAAQHRVSTLNYWTNSTSPADHVPVLAFLVERCLGAARAMDPYVGTDVPVGDPVAARANARGWWGAARFAAASEMRRRWKPPPVWTLIEPGVWYLNPRVQVRRGLTFDTMLNRTVKAWRVFVEDVSGLDSWQDLDEAKRAAEAVTLW